MKRFVPGAATFWSGAMEQTPSIYPFGQETQTDLRNALKQARHWHRYNEFVHTVVELRLSFCNHELELSSARKDAKFEKWLAAGDNERVVRRYIREVWQSFLVSTNVVSMWRENPDGSPILPITLRPERCHFNNFMGLAKLRYEFALTSEQVNDLVDPVLRARYGNTAGLKEIDEKHGEFFRVLTQGLVGEGLGFPSMQVVFPALRQWQAMSAGDEMLGEECRVLIKQHRLGHEIRTGAHAGSPIHFIRKARVDDLATNLKNKVGKIELPTNFDHEIVYTYLDGKFFDETRYDGMERRLLWWSSPIGQMIGTKGGVAPFLLTILKSQVLEARRLVADHICEVIDTALRPPGGLKVEWSNDVFEDPRLVGELLRVGLAAGPVSQRTFREAAGLDDERERAYKAAEAKQPDEEKLPIFDASHGMRPGEVDKPSGKGKNKPDAGAVDAKPAGRPPEA